MYLRTYHYSILIVFPHPTPYHLSPSHPLSSFPTPPPRSIAPRRPLWREEVPHFKVFQCPINSSRGGPVYVYQGELSVFKRWLM